MKRLILLLFLTSFFGVSSFSQKLSGFGGELSILSLKPSYRIWVSKTTGFDFFAGVASELEDFNPNDLEAGLKFLHVMQYNRTDRTYIGVMGKWKWVDVYQSYRTTNLPIPGVLIGKEWYSKRIKRKGFAVELGYQVGIKKGYTIYSPVKHIPLPSLESYEELPLILNLRYSFYSRR